MATKTPRDLPIEIKRQYHLVTWRQFWNHRTSTPIHLWNGRGDREGRIWDGGSAKALCGKVIEDDSSRDVAPEQANWLCKGCVRIALSRAAKAAAAGEAPPSGPPPVAVPDLPTGSNTSIYR